MKRFGKLGPALLVGAGVAVLGLSARLHACTGITLRATDGSRIYGRTMEWGAFDLRSRLLVVPRGTRLEGHTPEGTTGLTWTTRLGAVGLDALGRDVLVDGINEAGLTVGAFFHPGFAAYQPYQSSEASHTLAPTEVASYLLTTCATVAEARAAVAAVRVVPVVEPAMGMAPPLHFFVSDPAGPSLVIEYTAGELKLYDAPLGVITNAPTYDWHETNLRNYLNLSAVGLPDKRIEDLDFRPIGVGSGMIGLPGDFTPPSRFVRAVAFSQTARKTPTGPETLYELFRILDNFNVPLFPDEVAGLPPGGPPMRSSTLWTTGYDQANRVMYYHTQHNRRVRRVALGSIDFQPGPLVHVPMDREPSEDVEDVAARPLRTR